MGTNVISIKCSCGVPIDSENVIGSMVYCEACDSYKIISGCKILDNAAIYKINRFKSDSRECRQYLLDFLYQNGEKTLFDRLEVYGMKRYYVPVREIGEGEHRKLIQLNETNKSVADLMFKTPVINMADIRMSISEEDASSLNFIDQRPIYQQKKEDQVELLPIDVPMLKLNYIYNLDKTETIIRYLPVFILETNLCNITCVGVDENYIVLNKKEVIEIIIKNESPTLWERIKSTAVDIIFIGITLAVLVAGAYVIYKLFTTGMTVMLFFETLMYAFKAFSLVLAVGLMIPLIGALIAIFAPVMALIQAIVIVLRGDSYDRPNYKKGKILMSLNN